MKIIELPSIFNDLLKTTSLEQKHLMLKALSANIKSLENIPASTRCSNSDPNNIDIQNLVEFSTKFWISILLGSELLHLVDAGIFSRDLIFSERAFSIRCFCSSEVVLRRSLKIEGSSSMILRREYLMIQWQT